MWLPTPIYERIPQFWFLVGLLFIAAGLLLTFEFALSFWYIGLGFVSSAYGIAIQLIRMQYRQNAQVAEKPNEPAADAEPVANSEPAALHQV